MHAYVYVYYVGVHVNEEGFTYVDEFVSEVFYVYE